MPFIWRAGLTCNFPIIDKQHKELIEHFSDYIDSISEKTNEVTDRDMLNFLRQYVVDHFWSEEHLMKKYEYPEIHEHTAIHRQYVDDYKNLIANFKLNKDFKILRSGLRDMLSWFVDHITDDDQKLAGFLKSTSKDHKGDSHEVANLLEERHRREIQLREGTAGRPEVSEILANLLCFERGINEEHRDLIERFADFQKMDPKAVDVPKVKEMLNFLGEYVIKHFRHEEILMHQYEYPDLDDHTVAHGEYVTAYKKLLEDFKTDHDFAKLTKGITGMFEWFLRHIADFDVVMSFFIKNSALNLFAKKKVVLLAESPQTGKQVKDDLAQMGFHKIMECNEVPKAWDWIKTVGSSLLVIAEDGADFGGKELLGRLRERANDLPVLFLTTEPNKKNLVHSLEMQNRSVPHDMMENSLIETRPLKLESMVRGLDQLIFYYKRGSIALERNVK